MRQAVLFGVVLLLVPSSATAQVPPRVILAGAVPSAGTRLVTASCGLDVRQDWAVAFTKLRFDIWNSDEVKFSEAFECGDSWHETEFGPDFDAARDNFLMAVLGTYSARYRVQGIQSTQCPGSSPAGLLAVQSRQLVPDNRRALVGTTLAGVGKLAGRVTWDPAGSTPEGGVR